MSRRTAARATSLLLAGLVVAAGVAGCAPGPTPSPEPTVQPTPSESPMPSPSESPAPSPTQSPTPTPAPATPTPPPGTAGPSPSATFVPPAATASPSFSPTAYPQTWIGTWSADSGEGGSLDLTLSRGGSNAEGTIQMDGWACLASGGATGAIGGGRIQLTVSQREVEITFNGAIVGQTMQGRLTSDCDGLRGSWTLERTS